ncbi:DmsC/YnfH family molybdoenzyme membrane anchor subunit [Roseimaritima ulvae]|uniref:Anaerobic dimethyl sulfoxide reductase chain B n=1 Tax=Roseimaritima ulvae TaxID=980254 RepID=A0A5B9QVF2_9BACT|nr:DmsC/YnfH family molybdoenzyme membrane anchor subunit [Roseimaritima ulvae]QEG43027.1 Anaerobic dimethyl sulfoxide reductase chain B [Roseimaritima ulvae]
MSIALPKSQPSSDFVRQLLEQQQELTAVEQFSGLHEAGQLEAAAAVPDQAAYYRQLLPATPPAAGQQYAFEVDLDACSGCKACVVACHSLNGLEDDEAWRRVGTVVHEAPAELPVLQHVTTACHHCEDPGCLSGCPVKAYDKDPQTGIVKHLDDQCIGCKYCTMMCPYEVPQYSERLGIVRKCDMCQQRLSVGEAPACVQSCPNQAIKIRIVDQSAVAPADAQQDDPQQVDSQQDAARLAPGAPLSSLTRPTTVYQSRERVFSTSMAQDESIDPVAESHWPLAVMLVATQISVGMLVCERLIAAGMWMVGEGMPSAATRWTVTAALLIGGAGLNVAPLHLGQPRRAWRVFLGLRTSWLSREAIVLGKYMGALSLAAALLWLPSLAGYLPEGISEWIPAWAVPVTLAATLLLGAAGLYSSAMIYIVTKRRLWRMPRTAGRFFGTAAVAGAAWTVAVLWGTEQPPVWTLALGLLGLLGLAAKLVWEWKIQLGAASPKDAFDRRCQKLVRRDLSALARQRLIAGSLGAVLLSSACAVGLWSPAGGCATAVLAAGLISGGELAERILYFSSVVYDRMPGTLR